MSTRSMESGIGNERYRKELRQTAGLLLFFSTAVTMSVLSTVTAYSAPKTTTEALVLVGAIFELAAGVMGIMMGFRDLVYDQGDRSVTLVFLFIIQLSFLPFVGGIIQTIIGSTVEPSNNSFIPLALNPTPTDVGFVGVMGVISIVVYAFTTIGPMAFMGFKLYAFQSGVPNTRHHWYFRSRACFYDFLVVLGGFSQTALGSYLLSRFGSGPLGDVPIMTGFYVVSFPEYSVAVGVLQIMFGYLGLLRASSMRLSYSKRNRYQIVAVIVWFLMLVMQVLLQIGHGATPTNGLAGWAPTLACSYLGFAFMPAYLDHKMFTIPKQIPEDYYGDLEECREDLRAFVDMLCCC